MATSSSALLTAEQTATAHGLPHLPAPGPGSGGGGLAAGTKQVNHLAKSVKIQRILHPRMPHQQMFPENERLARHEELPGAA